jgi:hypothetical protein
MRLTADPVVAAAAALAGTRQHVDVAIPRTTIKARMRLVTRTEALSIKADAHRQFQSQALTTPQGVNPLTVADWNLEIAVRHLAVAVRNPADESSALSTLEEWRECDDDQIAALWEQYQDLRDRLDPVGDDATPVTEHELAELELAAKKKAAAVLMSYGSRKLARYVITLVGQPASSPTPK